jgi:hypothetical protein
MTILLSQKATVQRGYSEGYQFYTSWKFQIFDLCNFHLELKSSIASMAGRMSPACVGLPSHARSRQLRVPRAWRAYSACAALFQLRRCHPPAAARLVLLTHDGCAPLRLDVLVRPALP